MRLACLLVLVTLAAPAPVHACSPPSVGERLVPRTPSPDHTARDWGIAITPALVIDATLITIAAIAGADMLPDWAAGIELMTGILQSAAGTILLATMVRFGPGSCGPDHGTRTYAPPVAAGLMGLGGWLIAHAIWSFADGQMDVEGAPAVAPTVSLAPDGVLLGATGAF